MDDITRTLFDLAQKPTMDFRDASYFQAAGRELPTPQQVIEKWENTGRPPVVVFEEPSLVVKHGWAPHVSIDEALTLRYINATYHRAQVPSPEVFGWRRIPETGDSYQVFIYMSLARGRTLMEAWPELAYEDKESVCLHLQSILDQMRSIPQRSAPFLGSVCKGPIRDRYLQDYYKSGQGGPLSDVKSFNDHITFMTAPWLPAAERYAARGVPDVYRAVLTDDSPICFTHGDISPTNIMIVGEIGSGMVCVSSILDWEQSGWYPAYWEYCKICLSHDWQHEWIKDGWSEMVAGQTVHVDECEVLKEYWLWRGFP